MKAMLNELIQYRHLLYMLTWRDIKILIYGCIWLKEPIIWALISNGMISKKI